MAGHVFVSYSRDDGRYVRDLVAFLRRARLRVWVDEEIDHGERWENEIRNRIDTCAVFVPVMTPSSENSPWVSREILRAEARGRPIVPILLSGEVFFRLADVQFEDVRDRRMPGAGFTARLQALAGVEPEPPPAERPPVFAPAPSPAEGPRVFAPPSPTGPSTAPRPAAEPTAPRPAAGSATPRPAAESTAPRPAAEPTTPRPAAGPAASVGGVGRDGGAVLRPDRSPVTRRKTVMASVASAVAVVLAISVAFIWSNLGGGTPTGGPTTTAPGEVLAGVAFDIEGQARVPAPDVPGATRGGAVTVPMFYAIQDPAAMYTNNEFAVARLVHRTLTAYVDDPKGGFPQIVGDLATNAGTVSPDGLTWTFTLRDNLKFDDGTAITSRDVAYGIARSFTAVGEAGPVFYLREVLDPAGTYKGGDQSPPGVTTPDNKTIEFKLTKKLPTLPFVLAMPFAAPVPKARDGADYAKQWASSGPYKLASYTDEEVRLVRNDNWDRNTDPIRHAYVDSFVLKPNLGVDKQYEAFVDNPDTTVMTTSLTAEQVATAQAGAYKDRLKSENSNWMRLLTINTKRVTKLNVRRALNYAINRQAVVAAMGGDQLATASTTIVPATVPGYSELKRYNAGATGDIDMAKGELSGDSVKLTLCHRDSSASTRVARTIEEAFGRADIEVTLKALTTADYFTTISSDSNDCDLIYSGWAPDFPDASNIMGPLFTGGSASNFSWLNEPGITSRLSELASKTNRVTTAEDYKHLADSIMDVYVPVVPLVTERVALLIGASIRNAYISTTYGQVDLTAIYVASS